MLSQGEGTEGKQSSPQKDIKFQHPDKIERARRAREHDRESPTRVFTQHCPNEDEDPSGWYQREDCTNTYVVAMTCQKMAIPTPDGAGMGTNLYSQISTKEKKKPPRHSRLLDGRLLALTTCDLLIRTTSLQIMYCMYVL